MWLERGAAVITWRLLGHFPLPELALSLLHSWCVAGKVGYQYQLWRAPNWNKYERNYVPERRKEGQGGIILGSLAADFRFLCRLCLKWKVRPFSFINLSFSHQDQTRYAHLNKKSQCLCLEMVIYFVDLGFCLLTRKKWHLSGCAGSPMQFVFSLNSGRHCLPCGLLGIRGLCSASGTLAQQVGILFLSCSPYCIEVLCFPWRKKWVCKIP